MAQRSIKASDSRYPESELERRRPCPYPACNRNQLQERIMSINTSTLGHARKPAFSLAAFIAALFATDLREELAARDRAGQADGSYCWGM
jgi:hypothetical protein